MSDKTENGILRNVVPMLLCILMVGRNLHHSSPRKSAKLFWRKLYHAIYALDTWRNPVRTTYTCVLAINVCVTYSTFVLQNMCVCDNTDRVFLYNFADFKNSVDKGHQVFIFLLVAFPLKQHLLFNSFGKSSFTVLKWDQKLNFATKVRWIVVWCGG